MAMEVTPETPLLARQPLRTPSHTTPTLSHTPVREEEEEFEICTQHIDPRPLAGLIVFVDVRSGTDSCENRSSAIASQLETLGATVSQRFTKEVTHVVFKDGRHGNREKAEKKDVYMVSPLWVEACKRANDRVSEAKYPVISRDGSDTPVVLGRIKRIKSMQPKPLEVEIAKSLERSRKRQGPASVDTASAKRRREFVLATHSRETDMECSEESDSLELPTINLPSTPATTPGRTPLATPEATAKSVVAPHRSKPPSANTKQGSRDHVTSEKDHVTSEKDHVTSEKDHVTSRNTRDGAEKSAKAVAAERKVKQPRVQVLKPVHSTRSQKTVRGKATKKKLLSKNRAEKENRERSGVVKMEGGGSVGKRERSRRKKTFERERPTLVLTSVPLKDQEIVLSIVNKLGGFELSRSVCSSTTHLVCGSPRRTVNVLAATAKGCWILSLEWVWKSLEAGYWVKEEPFEMVDHFPASQFFRLERQAAGLLYRPSLFSPAGSVFIARDATPPPTQLELLLVLGGAKLTGSHRKADVCIGCRSWSEAVKSVTEQWVLDSITEHQLLPFEDYILDHAQSRAASPEL